MAKVVVFLIGFFGVHQTFGQGTRTAWSAQNSGMGLDGVPVSFMPGQGPISAKSEEATAQQYLTLLMRQNERDIVAAVANNSFVSAPAQPEVIIPALPQRVPSQSTKHSDLSSSAIENLPNNTPVGSAISAENTNAISITSKAVTIIAPANQMFQTTPIAEGELSTLLSSDVTPSMHSSQMSTFRASQIEVVTQPATSPATASESGTDNLTQLQSLLEGISPTQLQILVDLVKSRTSRGSLPTQPAKSDPPRLSSPPPPPFEQPQTRNLPGLIPPPPGSGNRGPPREVTNVENSRPQPYGQIGEQPQLNLPQSSDGLDGGQDNIPPWARNGPARNGQPIVRGGQRGQMGGGQMGGGQFGGLDPSNPMLARLIRVLAGRATAAVSPTAGEAPEVGEGGGGGGGMNPALMALMMGGGQNSGSGGDLGALLGLGGLGGSAGGGGNLASLLGGGGGLGQVGSLGGGSNSLALLQALGAAGQGQTGSGEGTNPMLQALLGGGQNTGGSGGMGAFGALSLLGGMGGLTGGA